MQHVSHDHGRFSVYWGNILVSTLGLGALLSGLIFFLGPHLVNSASPTLLLTVAIGDCVCQQLTVASSQVFQAFEKMRISAVLNTSINLLRLLVACFLLATRHHAVATQWAGAVLIVSALGALAAVVTVTLNFGKPAFSAALLAARAHDGFIYSVSGSTTTVYNDIDKVLLGHYGMNAANGIYSVAYKVINVSNLPMTSVYSATFPSFFDFQWGMRRTVPFAQKLVKKTSILGIAYSSAHIHLFSFDPSYPWGKLRPKCIGSPMVMYIPVFRSFSLSAGDAIAGAGNQRFRLYSQIVGARLNLALNIYLIPRYSWLGAAWASLLTDGSLGTMNWVVAFSFVKQEVLAEVAI